MSLRAVCFAAALVAAAGRSDVEEKFAQFEGFFGKNYAGDERAVRMAAFADNLDHIDILRQQGGGAIFSHLSPFADISPEDFSVRMGYKARGNVAANPAPLLDVSALPTSLDWRAKGAVNPVQNQKQCGSCWAFSTVANIEGAGFVDTGILVKLSEEQLVDCDTGNGGCNGGLMLDADNNMINGHYGLELESSYPYTGTAASCKTNKADQVAFITGAVAISQDEDEIAAALVKYGPLSIAINAGPLQLYVGDVLNLPSFLCPAKVDHGVAMVGFGEKSSLFGTTKYFIIRNSWGAGWGEQGYFRIVRGKGACGLNTMVSSATGVSITGSVAV